MARKRTMSETLKKAIAESGIAHIALERATGVKRASIMRFMRGEQSLRLDMADRLADYLGLVLVGTKRGRPI
jgi:plasmid maintenance system antidote protein VapI